MVIYHIQLLIICLCAVILGFVILGFGISVSHRLTDSSILCRFLTLRMATLLVQLSWLMLKVTWTVTRYFENVFYHNWLYINIIYQRVIRIKVGIIHRILLSVSSTN